VLLPRNAVGRNRFSLAMSSQEVQPLSDKLTPPTVPLPVRKFTCAMYAIWHPDIANDRYRVSRSAGAIRPAGFDSYLPVASARFLAIQHSLNRVASINRYTVPIGVPYAKKMMSKKRFIRDLFCCDSPTD
jgi:hypothetical protein